MIVGAGDSIWILPDRNMFPVFDSAGVVARTNRLDPLEEPGRPGSSALRRPQLYMTAEEYERDHRAKSMAPAPRSSQRRSRESIPPAERPMEVRPSSPGQTGMKAATVLAKGLLVVLLRTAAVNSRAVRS